MRDEYPFCVIRTDLLSCPRKPASDVKAPQIETGKADGELTSCSADNPGAGLERKLPPRPRVCSDDPLGVP